MLQKRVRVFYRGFQTRKNWLKLEAVGPRAFIVFECLETAIKNEARVFEITFQVAPNCKQKKKEVNWRIEIDGSKPTNNIDHG